jgi:tRNA modification GTPase
MYSTADTIVAIATPPGRGGIGIVRLSGPEARGVAGVLLEHPRPLEPRHATLTLVRRVEPLAADASGAATGAAAIDQVVATYFPAPASYTGDDVVEVAGHGSPVVLRAIVAGAVAAGARLAEPGEFTLRAYLNGRIDLPQAEAVADLIDAVTPLQARAAFDQIQGTLTRTIADIHAALFDLIARLEASIDFPEEGYHFVDGRSTGTAIDMVLARIDRLLGDAKRGRLVREGLQVAIVGPPNAGKSSLFNALVGAPRAIVAEAPGTTRDLVTETIDLDGLRVTLVDTAGLRQTDDVVEREGVLRTQGAVRVSDLVLHLRDGSAPPDATPPDDAFQQSIDIKHLTVISKFDLGRRCHSGVGGVSDPNRAVEVSALTGEGLTELRQRIAEALDVEAGRDRPEITNIRHVALVERARESLLRARRAAVDGERQLSEEFVLADLQDARAALEEITGQRTSDQLLQHIFSRFCVGK